MENLKLNVNVAGVHFKNPLIAASGTFGFGLEYKDYIDLNQLGGISVTGLTLEPRKGNPPPRIVETPSGILNSVGLQNPGVEYFIESVLPELKQYNTIIIANINGNSLDEYCHMASRLQQADIHMLELNLSCPNVKQGGVSFGTDPKMVYSITKAVKKHSYQPLVVKLTPNVTDITEIALAAQQGGADAISLVNTFLGMAIDVKTRRPVLGNITGGLSGPAIKPIALRMVWQVSKVVDIPIIGMGGIMTGQEVVEFLLAGATAVSVGTANLVSPNSMIEILNELKNYMVNNKIFDIHELIGGLIV
ncbi:MAG: dihydroorotate dehydrogenase [Clostridiales bacterium]|jgi:dihydroorotate dehydrogenase (NAD+) catalytic subunit|nr:dihydroorotate dehydrogenase [Clostridiales bacterium]